MKPFRFVPVVLLFLCSSVSAEPVRIVTLGDSITKGYRPGVKMDETFSAYLQEMLKKEGIEAEVVNVGIGGERTDQALARLARDVLAKKPKIVTIMYGANDSYVDKGKKEPRLTPEQYTMNLKTLVAELRKAGIQPILMTSNCYGNKPSMNGLGENPDVRLARYFELCREVARETKTPLVDHYQHWSNKAKSGFDVGKEWTTDQLHPNVAGHRAMAEVMLPVVVRTLKGS